jgi:hypothetical protein
VENSGLEGYGLLGRTQSIETGPALAAEGIFFIREEENLQGQNKPYPSG